MSITTGPPAPPERPRGLPITTRQGLIIAGLVLGLPLALLLLNLAVSSGPPSPKRGGRAAIAPSKMTIGDLRNLAIDLRPGPAADGGRAIQALDRLDIEPNMPALRDRCRTLFHTARFDLDAVNALADRVAVLKRMPLQQAWDVPISDALAALEAE